MSQLLIVELDAKPVDGAGGDEGIDCFIQGDDGSLDVFQAKYFIDRLTGSQRSQIEESLERALECHEVATWTLCIPRNHSPSERRWFETLARDHGTPLEWWGLSKLRTLVSKSPHIAEGFFPYNRIEKRLHEFETEIRKTLEALPSSLWRYEVGSWGQDISNQGTGIPRAYLQRARRLGRVIGMDGELLARHQDGYVAVDFYELNSYMASDSQLAWARPVIDYCIEECPLPLVLLPPFVLELQAFMKYVEGRGARWLDKSRRTQALPDMLTEFVDAFEEKGDSLEALQIFSRISRRLDIESVPFLSGGLPKLLRLIRSKRLVLAESWESPTSSTVRRSVD